jgi:hypothetical protein
MLKLIIESKAHGTLSILFDEEDRELVESHIWYVLPRGNTYYAQANIPHPDGGWYIYPSGKRRQRRQTTLFLHRLLMNPPKGMVIDHINHNGLDNRKENLRICTNAENVRNSRNSQNNTSGYKGVCWDKSNKKWKARIGKDYKQIHIGCFDILEEAARAYDAKAKELFGEYAQLNFPEE